MEMFVSNFGKTEAEPGTLRRSFELSVEKQSVIDIGLRSCVAMNIYRRHTVA